MKWYADSSGRRTFQIVVDVFLLCFLAVCVWLGKAVHDGISTLRGPADGLTSAGDSFRDNMSGAADSVGGIPLVGDGLKSPFEALSGSGQRLADVGTSAASTVDTVARVAGVAVAVVPIALALRALTRQPLRRLAPLGPNLARRFRDGDPVVVHQLAALELKSCGVSVDGGEASPRVPRLA